ncbi:MAG TPA: aspartate aminotransferase family protein [Candidatus Limnocylindrales bacterium]
MTQAQAPATHDALSPVLGRYFERTWARGEGHRLFDSEGKAYLDFACGIAVTALGHTHPRVTRAIHEQVDRLVHVSNGLGYIEPVSRLASALAATFAKPLDTVMFVNSGAEAVEGCLKLARRVTGRSGFIAFDGAFHGRTFGAASITSSNLNYRAGYAPFVPGAHLLPFPRPYRDGVTAEAASEAALAALREHIATVVPGSEIAAIVVEPIQGEGGFHPAPDAFLRGLRDIADEHGILLIVDEVQTGLGRTGTMWAFEAAGIVPDVVAVGKAIANGLPLAAVVASRELHERWGRGAHGTTFGGNPVACAAGLEVLATIADEDLVANARARGGQLVGGLRELASSDPRIGDIRGRGLMVGVELTKDRATREPDGELANAVIADAADRGLIVLTSGPGHEVVRWLPPLDVTAAEIDEGLSIFEAALGSA